jgi:hypothetical protein
MSAKGGSHLGAAVVACAIMATIGIQAGVRAASSRSPAAAASAAALLPSAVIGDIRSGAAGAGSGLDGVFCTSTGNCWAVGHRTRGTVTLDEMRHWDGTTWRAVPVPNPAGRGARATNELSAVRCVGARDCWAVGADSAGAGPEYGDAVHWNGRRWLRAEVPQPGGSKPADSTQINDLTCITASNCWAVGDYGTSRGATAATSNLVLHWNGERWSQVLVPDPDGSGPGHYNALNAVRCQSPGDCLADGGVGVRPGTATLPRTARNEALHWDGTRWSQLAAPDPAGASSGNGSQLLTLACGSPASCWGGGYYGAGPSRQATQNQILHWNGGTWTSAATPDPGSFGRAGSMGGPDEAARDMSYIIGATCSAARNCWAVGSYADSDGAAVNQALHWNGSTWSLVTTPDPAGTGKSAVSVLLAVQCTSAASCWAVGAFEKPAGHLQNEILHWNGTGWSVR